MKGKTQNLPLGDFFPADRWQTHVNSIFYGILGSQIHNHFQTYVSRDHRLAYALADAFFEEASNLELGSIFVHEWGVGNGNLAACFLDRLKEIDTKELIYPRIHYILCDYSFEILKAIKCHPRLKKHANRFFTIQADAENLTAFKPGSIHKIISNEIWDDLATKALLKDDGLYFEEYLQPTLDIQDLGTQFEKLKHAFEEKNFDQLKKMPYFLDQIFWERGYQRVELSNWPYSKTLEDHTAFINEKNPIPINLGAFKMLKQAFNLLAAKNLGYSGMDYGMLTRNDLIQIDRPYYNLYGGQYTFMVNFPLLADVGKSIGYRLVNIEHQHNFVSRQFGQNVISVLELLQSHPEIGRFKPWDRDILMLETLAALNSVYKNPIKHKMEYPSLPGTPKKSRKKIEELVKSLSPHGVPDTVAYITRNEVFSTEKKLRKLGYRGKNLQFAFSNTHQPISFVYSHFQK